MEYLLICKGQKKGVMADTNMTTALRQLKLEVDMDNYDEANVGTLDALMHNRTAVKTLTSAVFTHGMTDAPAVTIDEKVNAREKAASRPMRTRHDSCPISLPCHQIRTRDQPRAPSRGAWRTRTRRPKTRSR